MSTSLAEPGRLAEPFYCHLLRTLLKAAVQTFKGYGWALLICHQLKAQADGMATKERSDAWCQPIMLPVENIAPLFTAVTVCVRQ